VSVQCTTAALTRDEQTELWAAYQREARSREATSRLVASFLPLVHKALRRVLVRLPPNVAPEDLLQVGAIALWRMIGEFDARRGVPFEGFAFPRVQGAMLDYLRSEDRVPRSCRDRLAEVEKTIRRHVDEHGRTPSGDELAHAMGMTRGHLDRLIDQARPWLSLDLLVDGESGFSASEAMVDPASVLPSVEAERNDLCRAVRRGLMGLEPREQKVLYLYYYEDLTLAEIGALYELTEARISQIHAMAVTKLRAILSDSLKE
jgi:RNA polymerase sigma factor FliA